MLRKLTLVAVGLVAVGAYSGCGRGEPARIYCDACKTIRALQAKQAGGATLDAVEAAELSVLKGKAEDQLGDLHPGCDCPCHVTLVRGS